MDEAKPFKIPKREVWEAFKRVKANQGTPGVDGQSIAQFEADLRNNLYKLWNRLSSGSYFPPPVLRVEIPKADGGVRPLAIPTVGSIRKMLTPTTVAAKPAKPGMTSRARRPPRRSGHRMVEAADDRGENCAPARSLAPDRRSLPLVASAPRDLDRTNWGNYDGDPAAHLRPRMSLRVKCGLARLQPGRHPFRTELVSQLNSGSRRHLD